MQTFLIKLILNGIIIVPLLAGLSDASVIGALGASFVLSVMAYLIGDQIILRYTNNWIATIMDAVLTYLFLWLADFYMGWNATASLLIVISLSVGVIEYFLHWFMVSDFKHAR